MLGIAVARRALRYLSATGDEESAMKPFTNAGMMLAVGASAVALGACGSSKSSSTSAASSNSSPAQASKTCPHNAAADASYKGTFQGPQSTAQTTHVVMVTHNGQPVSGATVCVNTAMVGMTSMHYSVKAAQVGPGRYQAPFRFEMVGTYRGNVVTNVNGKAVSIPVSVYVSKTASMNSGSGTSMSMSTSGTMTHSMHMSTSTTMSPSTTMSNHKSMSSTMTMTSTST